MPVNFVLRVIKRLPYAAKSALRRREPDFVAPCLRCIRRIPRAVPFVFSETNGLIFAQGANLFRARSLSAWAPERIGAIPLHGIDRALAGSRLYDRAFRAGIQAAWEVPLAAGVLGYLAVNKNGWWLLQEAHEARPVAFDPPTPSMPMLRTCCVGADGMFYHGEYIDNPARRGVRIYTFDESEATFREVFAFTPGAIRHIHALLPDPHRPGRIWIFCGDLDSECNIYHTDDGFQTVNLFLNDGQKTRVVDAFFQKDRILAGMDSPEETPFVIRIPRDAPGAYETGAALQAPAYYATQNASGALYMGLTAEPGTAVEIYNACIVSNHDGTGAAWEKLYSVGSDSVPQHAILYLPSGILPENYLVFSSRAVRRDEGAMLIFRDVRTPVKKSATLEAG